MLERELKREGDSFEVRTWKLGDERDYREGMAALRAYLRDAGEAELADRLSHAVNEATPAVAVDGVLLCFCDCPTAKDVMERFDRQKSARGGEIRFRPPRPAEGETADDGLGCYLQRVQDPV